jgi:sugar lactone lactonase YvrE
MNLFTLSSTLLLSLSLFFQGEKYDPTTLVFPSFLHTLGVRKATTTHLYLFVGNRVKVNDPQGIAAVRLQSWEDPSRTKDDDEIVVYGVNAGQNVVIYNTSMNSIAVYGLYEKGERALKTPTGIAAHGDGEVYLADTGNNRIVQFFNPQRELQFVRSMGRKGNSPGEFMGPRGVALTASKMLFVADTENHRVQRFREGKLEKVWGTSGTNPGQLFRPAGIAATDSSDSWSYYKDNFVVVVDRDGKRLQKFSLDGRYLTSKNAETFANSTTRLDYCAIDYFGNVYVTDIGDHCIHKFDRHLNYLCSFGRYGEGDKEFIEPRGMAIYKRFGQVLIVEKKAVQYYWVGTDILDFRASRHPRLPLLQIDYFLTEPSYVTLQILNDRNAVLATSLDKAFRDSGKQREILDGHWQNSVPVANGATLSVSDAALMSAPPVASGRYTVRLTISATYSSYKYFEKTVESQVDF